MVPLGTKKTAAGFPSSSATSASSRSTAPFAPYRSHWSIPELLGGIGQSLIVSAGPRRACQTTVSSHASAAARNRSSRSLTPPTLAARRAGTWTVPNGPVPLPRTLARWDLCTWTNRPGGPSTSRRAERQCAVPPSPRRWPTRRRTPSPGRMVLRSDGCETPRGSGPVAAGPGPGRPLADPEHRLRPPERPGLAGDRRGASPGATDPDPRHPHHLATLTTEGAASPGTGSRTTRAWRSSARPGTARRPIDPSRVRPIRRRLDLLGDVVTTAGAVLRRATADVVVVCTPENRAVDWLIAGEAVQRLVLEAADAPSSPCPRFSATSSCRRTGPGSGSDSAGRIIHRSCSGSASPPPAVRGRRRPLADVLVAHPQDR